MLGKFFTIACLVTFILSDSFGQVIKDDKISAAQNRVKFLRIFDGKDLTGWEGEPRFWSVRDGAIVAQVEPDVRVRNHSYLIWQDGKVTDFELRLKVRSTKGNSGIDYRAEPVPADKTGQQLKWTIRGYQSDIAQGWMGSLYNWGKPGAQPSQFVVVEGDEAVNQRVGSVVDKDVLYQAEYYKPGQWNEFTIVARGSHILHRINGYLVVEFIDNGRDTRRQGLLGLQVHTGQGPFLNEFKDIRIKQFNINFGQAELLFNGQDLNGWTFSSAETKSAWSVENGVLVNKGKPDTQQTAYICTKDDYTNYVLRFQYRRLGDGESGVLLRLAALTQDRPKFVRVYGKGDDFNRIDAFGDFRLKVRKQASTAAFRKMPEKFWNECEVTLNKGHLEVKVNDVVRATSVRCEQAAGNIGFEASGSRLEYRNIVLIPILTE